MRKIKEILWLLIINHITARGKQKQQQQQQKKKNLVHKINFSERIYATQHYILPSSNTISTMGIAIFAVFSPGFFEGVVGGRAGVRWENC